VVSIPDFGMPAGGPRKPRQQVRDHANRARGLTTSRVVQEPKTTLQSELSTVLRLQLVEELAAISSADEGVAWAQRRLAAKKQFSASRC
jgi:hypothetical protein